MRKKLVALAVLLLVPVGVQAATFLSHEDTVNQSGPVVGDLFAASNTVLINQPVDGDVFAAGERVETSGAVTEDVFAAGNTVIVSGAVGDDVYATGNTVLISAPRVSDIFAAGNTVTMQDDTTASGDVYLAGATIRVAGTIEGDLRIASEDVVIEETARIAGNLTTYGSTQPTVREGAVIEGSTTHHRGTEGAQPARQALFLNWLRSVATWFIVAVLALYLLPHVTGNVLQVARDRLGATLLTGIGWLVLFLPVAILLMISILGLPLGFALLALTAVLLIAAYAYAQILLGDVLSRRFFKLGSLWQQALLGVVVFKVVQLLPVIGGIITFILLIWALGAIVLAAVRELRTTPATPVRA